MKIKKLLAIGFLTIAMVALGIVMLASCGECVHEWDEGTVIKQATCSQAGEIKKVCKNDPTHVQVVEYTVEHSFTNYVSQETATCTTEGIEVAKCDNEGCNATHMRAVPPLDHTFNNADYVLHDASCSEPERLIAPCATCGVATDTKIKPNGDEAIGHTAADNYLCSVCNGFLDSISFSATTYEFTTSYDISAEDSSVYALIYTARRSTDTLMIITGEGATRDFGTDTKTRTPWINDKYNTTTVAIIVADDITYLGNYIFNRCEAVTTVTLSANIEAISAGTFTSCKKLGEVAIPDSVKVIGESAFDSCDSLSTVTFSSEAQLEAIENSAFTGCKALKDVVLPKTTVSIGSLAFSKCSSTGFVLTIPEGIEYIAHDAFDGTKSIITEDAGLSYIKNNGNEYAILLKATDPATLKTATVNANTDIVLGSAFYGCNNLYSLSVADGNDTLHSIYNCIIDTHSGALVAGIKTSSIPSDGSVTTIAANAFSGCKALENITIPASILVIENNAFADCTALKTVAIEEGVGYIENAAFAGCTAVAQVILPYTGSDLNATESAHLSWIFGEDTVPAALKSVVLFCGTEIKEAAFANCKTIEHVYIPETIETMHESAFVGCTGLKAVYINDLVAWCEIEFTDYHSNPLYYAGNLYLDEQFLTELVIPEEITEIAYMTFAGCTSITEITFPASISSIGIAAFTDCTSLESIVIPESITEIAPFAFAGCTSLSDVTLSEGLIAINDKAFMGCDSLININIPASVTEIDITAFNTCRRLESITVSEGNTVYTSVDGKLALITNAEPEVIFTPEANKYILDTEKN